MKYDTVLKSLQEFQTQHFSEKDTDIKHPKVLLLVRNLADQILHFKLTNEQLAELEKQMCADDVKSSYDNLTHLAVKLAKSKTLIHSSTKKIQVSIVMPAYGENTRMKKRGIGEGHDPLGEDFIVEKSKQLKWLFEGTKSVYHVFIVDDMSKPDPITSGKAAELVIEQENVDNFTVLYLEDGVKAKESANAVKKAALKGVEYPKNTKKAGAVYYGIAEAISRYGKGEDHIIFLTDCDLSVDLGQLGNLVGPLLSEKTVAAAGSRRLPESILEIVGSRNLRANTARYFRQLLLPGLLPKDTQCGAKAFKASALDGVLSADRKVLDFAFDIELLTLLALQNKPEQIVPAAVAWFDSAELTTTDSSVHFGIMKAQLAIAEGNKTGSGPVFDELVEISKILTSSEAVWLGFLTELESKQDLVESMQKFDTTILPQLKALAQKVAASVQ